MLSALQAKDSPMSDFREGDRVAYSAKFLRSLCIFTGPMPQARGVVKKLENLGDMTLAEIQWIEGYTHVGRVNVANLARIGTRAMYAD
jgi:hypothetical protein